MKNIECLIVEDEVPAIEEIKFNLSRYNDIIIKGCATNYIDALAKIEKQDFDAVFLDINIPGGSGIELGRIIKRKSNKTDIIFITAYDEYAIKAFEFNALDYILKPIDEKRFDETINRLRESYKRKNNNIYYIDEKIEEVMKRVLKEREKAIPCEVNGKIILISLDDIIYFSIEQDRTIIKTFNNTYETKFTLNELEEMTGFLRTHRSFLVNPNKVKEIHPWFNGTYKMIMKDNNNSEIPVSRSKSRYVRDYYNI
ncbi:MULTISPECIES: LytR/AlgR family response regulator transcription factor [Caloramator]|uniref:Stage 0 sporulation protein A homolog n=1 Tax=Caloramator proteoclasticus DSM 10124 TaxID=1121262 RepID=A0A1M4TBK3_9CLOT|nr:MULTISPECIES: LytTR family DNA-binding domain-containing protein [Caloramator]SHE41912.1 two component transcriptional regulator, LytTR family [Caloramator proteoclasticus DSM 10124]